MNSTCSSYQELSRRYDEQATMAQTSALFGRIIRKRVERRHFVDLQAYLRLNPRLSRDSVEH